MGTTLTNGIYLPNEGEKNCYAGLKTNWETLDQKIADIAALQQAVAGALHREIVENLPTTDIDPNTIYMILSGTSATENVYDEYMYVNNAWELIGTSATDLTNYYTKGDVDGLLLLKANASDLTSHTGDTTIHVTSADKSKWNTVALIKQLRLVNTQVGSATTIAFANIDDTNGIKVGDKCMDLDAKMFEITAVDTTNQTVTVGSALIDLAQDSDVVHKSGNETISGDKVFNNRLIKNIDVVLGTAPSTGKFSNIDIADNNKASLLQILGGVYDNGLSYARFFVQNKTADDGTGLSPTGTLRGCGFNITLPASSTSEGQGSITPRGNKTTDFGLFSYQWRNLWCEKLFLNGTQLDPSAFALDNAVVHLSGNETVGGEKTFSDLHIIGYGTQYKGARNAYILPEFAAGYSGLSITTLGFAQTLKIGNFVLDANNKPSLDTSKAYIQIATGESNGVNACVLEARNSTSSSLGTSANRWSKIYGTEYYYGSNNVEFSTKFVTTDTDQTVSGQKVFTDINAISSSAEIGVSAGNNSFKVLDKNKKTISRLEGGTFSSGMAYSYWLVNNGSDVFNGVSLYQASNNLAHLRPYSSTLSLQLGASNRSFSDCYTSKINGVEPSSLSLPSDRSARIDISSYFTDTSNGGVNRYTAPSNGFVYLMIDNVVTVHMYSQTTSSSTNFADTRGRSTAGQLYAFLPVRKGDVFTSQWYTTATNVTLTNAFFIPCQGNV